LVKTKDQDSIQKDDAIKLCRSYAYFRTAFYVQLKGKKYLERVENEKYIVQDSVLITTKDNAKISAVVYRLRSDSLPKPVVLNFSIYPSEGNYYAPKMSVSNGYVGVAAYTRGKRFSPDDVVSFEKDGQDIYVVVDWISKQPWCNGKVGMYGGSYLGFAQWSAMKKRHPALKTIVPMVSVGPGVYYPMYNNVFMSYMLRWIHYVENNKFIDSDEFYNEKKWDSLYVSWYKSGKAFSKLDSIDKRPSKTFQRWISHPSYDSYWQNMMPYQNDFSKIDIPILSFTGYFDADQQGALHYLNEHYKYKPNANHYLVIGPYNHEGAQGYVSKTINGYKLDSVANIEPLPMTFQWFDYILKDSIKPKFLKDRINYQVMGTNTWKSVASVRAVANDTLTFYLDHTLKKDNYVLNLDKPQEKGSIKEEFDFLDRIRILPFEKMPPKLVDSVIRTDGKKVFVSKVFDKDIEITGSFRGTIDLKINKKDLDIAMELYELKEDGNYISLSTYLGRASYAKNRSKRKLLRPNKKESVSIKNSSFISKLVNKGSRLVLALGVNKNPKWQINYGTGKDVSTESIEDGKVPLNIKWLNSSTIRIPVFREK
jgi:putative CocE/NonD family hydrolase